MAKIVRALVLAALLAPVQGFAADAPAQRLGAGIGWGTDGGTLSNLGFLFMGGTLEAAAPALPLSAQLLYEVRLAERLALALRLGASLESSERTSRPDDAHDGDDGERTRATEDWASLSAAAGLRYALTPTGPVVVSPVLTLGGGWSRAELDVHGPQPIRSAAVRTAFCARAGLVLDRPLLDALGLRLWVDALSVERAAHRVATVPADNLAYRTDETRWRVGLDPSVSLLLTLDF